MTEKEKIIEKEAKLIELTGTFCSQKLDGEYLLLCQKLIKKLGRKRNVPFAAGKIEIWAAAIIHALGAINFLFDKSFQPFTTIDEINDYFGTKKSTTSNKSNDIRKMLKLQYFDREFSIQRVIESNPLNEMVMVDDMIIPVSSLPPEHQEMVREARKRGEDISFRTK